MLLQERKLVWAGGVEVGIPYACHMNPGVPPLSETNFETISYFSYYYYFYY